MLAQWAAIATDIGIIVGLLSPPLYGVWRTVIRPRVYTPAMAFLARVDGGVKTLDRIEPQVAQIMKNIGPNGGAAVIDKLDLMAARLDLVVDELPWPKFEAAHDGSNTKVNHQFERTFGYSVADLAGHGWRVLLHEDDSNEYIEAWDAAVKQQRPFFYPPPGKKLRFRARDGSLMTVNVSAFPRSTNRGLVVWMGTVQVTWFTNQTV